jgi:hypothetical protein
MGAPYTWMDVIPGFKAGCVHTPVMVRLTLETTLLIGKFCHGILMLLMQKTDEQSAFGTQPPAARGKESACVVPSLNVAKTLEIVSIPAKLVVV